MNEQTIIDRLKEGEEKLAVYDAYRKDPASPKDVVQVVSFAYLFELMAYSAILKLVPSYVPPKEAQIRIAQEFGGTVDHVSVVNGKVQVNPSYYAFRQTIQELKEKRNG
jgi:hypothetical protein